MSSSDDKHDDLISRLRSKADAHYADCDPYTADILLEAVAALELSASGRTFPICKDHKNAEWNQPKLEGEDCVLCRLFYLEAQESLLEEWQQRAKRAEATIEEVQRPLDAQMARLNATVTRLNEENERLRSAQSAPKPTDISSPSPDLQEHLAARRAKSAVSATLPIAPTEIDLGDDDNAKLVKSSMGPWKVMVNGEFQRCLDVYEALMVDAAIQACITPSASVEIEEGSFADNLSIGLARMFKVSKGTVRRWLNGESAPHPLGQESVLAELRQCPECGSNPGKPCQGPETTADCPRVPPEAGAFIGVGYVNREGGVNWEPNRGPMDLNPGQIVYVSHLPQGDE
jgi:hypothetical protein